MKFIAIIELEIDASDSANEIAKELESWIINGYQGGSNVLTKLKIQVEEVDYKDVDLLKIKGEI